MSLARAREAKRNADDESSAPAYACRVCRAETSIQDLTDSGGMCFRCFSAWKRTPVADFPDVGHKDKHGLKSWAYALRRREESGARLTQFQRDAWREALGHGHESEEA